MSHIADFLKSCPEGEDFDELRRNTPGEDGFDASFVGVLHEAWHWDDALWQITASMIIFNMQTGFGMLESGCVSLKNEVNIMMKNLVEVVLGGITYWSFGYGLRSAE